MAWSLLFAFCTVHCALALEAGDISKSPTTPWESGKIFGPKDDPVSNLPELSRGVPENEPEMGLMELVDVGLENNPSTRSYWNQARSAAYKMYATRSAYYPTVTLKNTLGFSKATQPAYPGFTSTKQLTDNPALSITYLLLDFGSRAAAAEAAKQTLFASNFQFNQSIQDTIYNIMNSYYDLDIKQSLVESNIINLKMSDTTLKQVEVKKKAGLASQTDLYTAIQNQAQAVYTLESSKGDLLTSRATLLKNVGLPANSKLRVAPPPPLSNLSPLDTQLDNLILQAMERRPDVAAKVATVLAKKATARKANADIWPTISLNLNGQRTFFDANYSFPPSHYSGESHYNNYSASVVFSVDLFDGFSKLNTARSARADVESAKADLAQSELQAIADVVTNYNNVQTAIRKVTSSQVALEASQVSYDSTSVSYKAGLKTLVDLITAQNNLATSRSQNIQARDGLFQAAVQLTKSTGTLSPKNAAIASVDPASKP
ncbi:MAG: TolC family protein [Verrucomicrobiae bacterium]|nr:TolC family protein [Verrucomicrobiae bacterium]